MKWINIKNVLLNKLNILTFIPELLSRQKIVWVSYALPRWKKTNYNWGDDVNSVLVNIISSKVVIPYQCSLLKRTHYLCIGSIIQWYSDENAVIWGSGLLYPVKSLKTPKQVLAVRGPLTRECLIKCGITCPPVYGDPALLFPRYYNPIIQKQYKFGIICHVSEINDIKLKSVNKPIKILYYDDLIDIFNYVANKYNKRFTKHNNNFYELYDAGVVQKKDFSFPN